MKPTLKLHVDGKEVEVDAKTINLLCHRDEMRIDAVDPDVVTIDIFATTAFAGRLSPERWAAYIENPAFLELWRLIFGPQHTPSATPSMASTGERHVLGLIVLSLRAVGHDKRPYWKFPESGLHPSAQLGLADLALCLAMGPSQLTSGHAYLALRSMALEEAER